VALHRKFYEYFMDHVCVIIANSISVQKKVRKYLDRFSEVIYPPVDTTISDLKDWRFLAIGEQVIS